MRDDCDYFASRQYLYLILNCIFRKILFTLIACCSVLNVLFENDLQSGFEGIYSFQGFSNGMDYWVDAQGVNAIWYKESSSAFHLIIGTLANLGSMSFSFMDNTGKYLGKKCPNNEVGYVHDWIGSSDLYIKCANEDDFCTSQNLCGTDLGDCDKHDECQDGLYCGLNNCPDYLGFHSDFDCCYSPTLGHQHFCTTVNPCSEDEGDCDIHDECQNELVCGTNNCPESAVFNSDIDCCYNTTIGDKHFCTIDNPCSEDEGDCDSNNQCKTNLFCNTQMTCPEYLGFSSDVNCCSSESYGCKIH